MELIKYPDKILTIKSEVVAITPEVKKFVLDMFDFMHNELPKWGKAVGLAAPQVGKNWRIFIALNEVFINPEITWIPKGGENYCKEGCFSLDAGRFDYPTKRAYKIKLKWQDLDGNWHEDMFGGFKCQVIQHEYDHIEGRLCCGEENKNVSTTDNRQPEGVASIPEASGHLGSEHSR